jgi:hypothetical protein
MQISRRVAADAEILGIQCDGFSGFEKFDGLGFELGCVTFARLLVHLVLISAVDGPEIQLTSEAVFLEGGTIGPVPGGRD